MGNVEKRIAIKLLCAKEKSMGWGAEHRVMQVLINKNRGIVYITVLL